MNYQSIGFSFRKMEIDKTVRIYDLDGLLVGHIGELPGGKFYASKLERRETQVNWTNLHGSFSSREAATAAVVNASTIKAVRI